VVETPGSFPQQKINPTCAILIRRAHHETLKGSGSSFVRADVNKKAGHSATKRSNNLSGIRPPPPIRAQRRIKNMRAPASVNLQIRLGNAFVLETRIFQQPA